MAWNQFQPKDFVTAVLVEEFVTTYWRIQRPRRYETAEIRRRLDTAVYRHHYEKISEVDSLKSSFIRDYVALQSASTGLAERTELSLSLERTRRQLEEKSLGLKFLIRLIEPIEKKAKDRGCISEQDEMMLVTACGVEDEDAKFCVTLNLIAKTEKEKMENDASADKTAFELNKTILCMKLKSKRRTLWAKEKALQKLESAEESAYISSLVMPPAECAEKIHRAEAALERSLFKILNTLLALQGVELPR